MGMANDEYESTYERMIEGLRILQSFGMKPTVDLDDRASWIRDAEQLVSGYEPEEIAEMPDADFDGYLLMDLVSNVVFLPADHDFEAGEYADIVKQCATVAGQAFPATDIVETRLKDGWKVTWKIGHESFKVSGSLWGGTDIVNQVLPGPERFYYGSWEMMGYIVYITPEQAAMARATRGWPVFD